MQNGISSEQTVTYHKMESWSIPRILIFLKLTYHVSYRLIKQFTNIHFLYTVVGEKTNVNEGRQSVGRKTFKLEIQISHFLYSGKNISAGKFRFTRQLSGDC